MKININLQNYLLFLITIIKAIKFVTNDRNCDC